jgi:DUF2934 family protein
MMPRPRKTAGLPKKQAAKVPATPTHEKTPPPIVIATRAYELFLQRGGVHGYDREDWLTAERELLPDASAEG